MGSDRGVTLDVERRLLARRGTRVAGVDEVGRGSIFGPVGVGVVVTDGRGVAPEGLADSKELSPGRREGLVDRIQEWAVESAVGYASAEEIDRWGISRALGLAGRRALTSLSGPVDWVILDGAFNWLAERDDMAEHWPAVDVGEVTTKVKADRSCASVAAASVLAKVDRDRLIVGMAEQFPGYGLESHKGYATPAHIEALARLGISGQHRRSWNLEGLIARRT